MDSTARVARPCREMCLCDTTPISLKVLPVYIIKSQVYSLILLRKPYSLVRPACIQQEEWNCSDMTDELDWYI